MRAKFEANVRLRLPERAARALRDALLRLEDFAVADALRPLRIEERHGWL